MARYLETSQPLFPLHPLTKEESKQLPVTAWPSEQKRGNSLEFTVQWELYLYTYITLLGPIHPCWVWGPHSVKQSNVLWVLIAYVSNAIKNMQPMKKGFSFWPLPFSWPDETLCGPLGKHTVIYNFPKEQSYPPKHKNPVSRQAVSPWAPWFKPELAMIYGMYVPESRFTVTQKGDSRAHLLNIKHCQRKSICLAEAAK